MSGYHRERDSESGEAQTSQLKRYLYRFCNVLLIPILNVFAQRVNKTELKSTNALVVCVSRFNVTSTLQEGEADESVPFIKLTSVPHMDIY